MQKTDKTYQQPDDLNAKRKEKRAAAVAKSKELDAQLRSLVDAKGIGYPIRIRMAALPNTGAVKDEIRNCGNGIFLIRSGSETGFRKVQKIEDMWTCNCPKWRRRKKIDCQHITKVRAKSEGKNLPYEDARRREATRILFPESTPSEHTRRKKARDAWPVRCPELFEELCRQIKEPSAANPKGGAPRVPLAVRVYALLIKMHFGLTYSGLSHYLLNDPAVQRLGWLKGTRISASTLCAMFADGRLSVEFKKMIERTAHTGHHLEDTAIIDSTGLSNSLAANYCEEKYGLRRKRKGRIYLKAHCVTGQISNLVPYVDFTLDYGLGSGDAPNYRAAARQTKRVWTELKLMLGDGSYGPKGNGNFSTELGITLFTLERRHERRSKWGGKAAEIAEMQSEFPEEFAETYRDRSRGEIPHSRVKRQQPYQRLRRRRGDTTIPREPMEDKVLCELPDDQLDEILASARAAVGTAQRNEAFALYVTSNVREVVTLEHLHDQRMSLAAGSAFNPIQTIEENELRAS